MSPAAPENHTADNVPSSWLTAWDPVRQREAWRVPTPGIWNGGTMTTAGNLVFEGQADGRFNAYTADTGKLLWSFDAKMGISGAPITYSVDGRQYISVVAGWGGSIPGFLGAAAAQFGWTARLHQHRLLTFTLDGRARLPDNLPAPALAVPIEDPKFTVDIAKAQRGNGLFLMNCGLCHGYDVVAGGFAPDLRASPVALSAEAFAAIVKGGTLIERGMPRFDELSDQQLEDLRHFIRSRARESLQAARTPLP